MKREEIISLLLAAGFIGGQEEGKAKGFTRQGTTGTYYVSRGTGIRYSPVASYATSVVIKPADLAKRLGTPAPKQEAPAPAPAPKPKAAPAPKPVEPTKPVEAPKVAPAPAMTAAPFVGVAWVVLIACAYPSGIKTESSSFQWLIEKHFGTQPYVGAIADAKKEGWVTIKQEKSGFIIAPTAKATEKMSKAKAWEALS